MEGPAFFEPYKWFWISSPAFCGTLLFVLVKYGHKWCAVILHHKREMLRINLKEAARKEALKRKVEGALERRMAKGKNNDKGNGKRKRKRIR